MVTKASIIDKDKDVWKSLKAGGIGAIYGTLLFQPLEVLKTRSQAPVLEGKKSLRVLQIISNILYDGKKHNGPKWMTYYNTIQIFWAGTIPALWRAIPGVVMYLTCLKYFEPIFIQQLDTLNNIVSGELEQQSYHMAMFSLGFTARAVTTAALMPFTVIKTQAEAGFSKNASISSAFGTMREKYQIRNLYSGILPSIMRDCPYSGIQLVVYASCKNWFLTLHRQSWLHHDSLDTATGHQAALSPGLSTAESGVAAWPARHSSRSSSSLHPIEATVCAGVSGLFACAITQPFDVLRVHRQLTPISASHSEKRASWREVMARVVRQDGLTGLWRGLLIRSIRRVGLGAVFWSCLESA